MSNGYEFIKKKVQEINNNIETLIIWGDSEADHDEAVSSLANEVNDLERFADLNKNELENVKPL